MATELDFFEYANDAAAQAAYVSSDATPTPTITQSNTTGGLDRGIDWTQDGLSQGFQVTTEANISKFTFPLKRSAEAGAVGTLTGYIYSDNGSGLPNTSLATFSTIDVATLTQTYVDKDFTGNFTPTVNTQYHIVFIWTNGSTDAGLRMNCTDDNPYAYGVLGYRSGGTWYKMNADYRDAVFYIYQDAINLQDYSEAIIKQQGSYSLKGVALQTGSLNDTLTRTVSPTIDLSGQTSIKFDIYASRTGSNIKIGIHDSGGTTTEKTHTITDANTWETDTWDISAVSNANKDAIDSIIITVTNADAANTFYLDNMFARLAIIKQCIFISD